MIGGAMILPSPVNGSRLLVLALLALLPGLGGCNSKPERDTPIGASDSPRKQANAESEKRPPQIRTFDAEGGLLPSDDYIVGIRLPRGAEIHREDGVLHVYRIRAPIDKVLAYFGPMMITGNVERRGKGAIYKRASVRGAEINPTKVDVSILEIGSRVTRVAVTELPPPSKHAPSSERTKAAAKEAFRTLD